MFAGSRLWLVTERSEKVAVSLYDLMRRTAPLVWLVGKCSIPKGGGCLFNGVDCCFEGRVYRSLSALALCQRGKVERFIQAAVCL